MAIVFIAGEARETTSSVDLRAPWDGAHLGSVGQADEALADEALRRATEAFAITARLPSRVRRDLLHAIARGVATQSEALARTICEEAGKPITQARAEVARAVLTFTLGAEEATRITGEALPLDHAAATDGALAMSLRVPAGVVVAITPFNFPLNLVAHKLAPAFAVGAPVVLKPAPQTPLTALALAAIVREACDAVGAPRAMLSVIPCPVQVAERLVTDPRPAVISFTGSAAVGWSLRAKAGRKKVLLELGGNAAAIVHADADLDHALSRIVPGAYAYAGQVCIKVQRVFVHADVAARFTESLAQRTAETAVHDPLDERTLCGPLIDARSSERVRAWLDEAIEMGARVRVGGARSGNRLTPALVEDAWPGMRVVDEEVFGPVLTVHPYADLDVAIAQVNSGRYGLQAGIFTRDLDAITRAFRGLDVGGLIVGDAPTFRADAMPYGGVKDSGFGREGVRYAIEEFTERRVLVLRRFLG